MRIEVINGGLMKVTAPDQSALELLKQMKKFKPRCVSVEGTVWTYMIKEFHKNTEAKLLRA